MNHEIKLPVGFFDHPKTRKLSRSLAADGIIALIRLWTWAATNSIEGWLPIDADEIEIEQLAHWRGEPGALFRTLRCLRFIDDFDGDLRLHEWVDHQPYVAGAQDRIERAHINGRKSAEARRKKFGTAQPPSGDPPELVVRTSSSNRQLEQVVRTTDTTRPTQRDRPTRPTGFLSAGVLDSPEQSPTEQTARTGISKR